MYKLAKLKQFKIMRNFYFKYRFYVFTNNEVHVNYSTYQSYSFIYNLHVNQHLKFSGFPQYNFNTFLSLSH